MIYPLLLQVLVVVVLAFLFTTQSAAPPVSGRVFLEDFNYGSDFTVLKMDDNKTPSRIAWLAVEYERLLEDFPLVTKSTTAAIVSFIGDILAQSFLGGADASIDWERVGSVSAEGLFVSGPLLHLAYDWMDQHVMVGDETVLPNEETKSSWNSMLQSFLQVGLDIFVMDSVFAMTLMVVSALLQRRSFKQIYSEIKSESFSAILAAWASSLFLSPLQFCNFQFVPVQYRVLITNVQDVLWNAAVSYTAHRHRGPVSTKEKSG